MQDLSGRKLGNYELRERLGRGGMAEVYKAYQAGMDRFVAVKVMLGHLANDGSFIERFKREAQAVGKLRHPNIVQIFDFGIEDDVYYMAMEFLDSGTLKEYIQRKEKLSPQEALRIMGQLSAGLEYAHQSGMIHRDLKPANVMFTDRTYKQAVLTDFGIARILGAAGLTGTGMSVGTPAYMSPEAGLGQETDARVDIYALGVILYEMLTGEAPYDADTPLAVIMKHINAPLPGFSQDDEIPDVIQRLVLKCMAKDPDERYQTAGELNKAVQNAISELEHKAVTKEVAPQAEAKTKISPSNIREEDVPTTQTQPDSRTERLPDMQQKESSNPLPVIGIIIVVGIIAIAAFLALNNGGNAANATATSSGEVAAATEEAVATEEVQFTDTPVPTEVPPTATRVPTEVPPTVTTVPTKEIQPTATRVPTEIAPTEVPAATTVPENNNPMIEPAPPPNPNNLNLLTGISPIMDDTDSLVLDGNTDQAQANLDSILADNPNDIDALFARSEFYSLDWDENNQARQDAEQIIALAPDNVLGYIALSDSWLTYPDYDSDKAQQAILKASKIEPENPQVLWRFAGLGDWEQQADRYLKAEELGADGFRFIHSMGEFFYANRNFARAIPYLETDAMKGNQDFYFSQDSFWMLLGAYIATGHAGHALDMLNQRGIVDTSTEAADFSDAAYVAYSAENYQLAQEWSDTARALSPEAYGATYVLGLMAWRVDHDADKALEFLNSLEGKDIWTRYLNFDFGHDLNLDRARILTEAGRLDEALNFYNQVIAENDYTDWLYEERANVYLQLGDKDAARSDLQHAFEITENSDYRNHLRQLLVTLGPASTNG